MHRALGGEVRVRWSPGTDLVELSRERGGAERSPLPARVDAGLAAGGSWLAERLEGVALHAAGRTLEPFGWAELYAELRGVVRAAERLAARGLLHHPPGPANVRVVDQLSGRRVLEFDPYLDAGPNAAKAIRELVRALRGGGSSDSIAASSAGPLSTIPQDGEVRWSLLASRLGRLLDEPAEIARAPELRKVVDGRYELLGALGAGGMGRTYRALDRVDGGVVCVKVAHLWNSSRPTDELAREFELLAALRHPNLLRALGYGVDASLGPYVVSELVEGGVDIVEAARGRPLATRVELAAQLFDALDFLHRQGVIHRDVKPGNVLVVDGRARLLDFGLGLFAETTLGGGPAGTAGFMAPEVLAGARATRQADIWAAGALAWELVAGESPFDPRSTTWTTPRGALPVGAAAVLVPLLAVAAADRPSAAEAAQGLRAAFPRGQAFAGASVHRFVGREPELALVQDALGRARERNGTTLYFEGPAGIGKTRLLQEIWRRAILSGVATVTLAAEPRPGPARRLWQPLLRWLAHEGAGQDVAPVPRGADDSLAAADARFRAELVAAVRTVTRPVLIAVEDVHWVPADDWGLLAHLAEVIRSLPIVLVLSGRPTGSAPNIAHCTKRSVEPLLPNEARALVAMQGAERALPPALVRGADGEAVGADRWAAALVKEAASLPAEGRRALWVAAVGGGPVELAEIDSTALRTAFELGFVEWSQGEARFAHDLHREAVLAHIPAADLAELHDRAAEVQLRALPVDHARAAWHLQNAGRAAEATTQSLLAAEAAYAAGAVASVLELTERVTELEAAAAQRVHFLRGEALYALGHPDRGFHELAAACAHTGIAVPRSSVGWARAGLVEVAKAVVQPWLPARAPRDLPGAALTERALMHLGVSAFSANQPGRSVVIAVMSLNLCLSLGDGGAVARQYAGLQMGFGNVGMFRLAEWLARRGAAAAARGSRTLDAALSAVAAAYYHSARGEWAPVEAKASWGVAELRALNLPRKVDEGALALAWADSVRWRQAAARAGWVALAESARARGDRQMECWALLGLAIGQLETGAPEQALTTMEGVDAASSPEPGTVLAIRAAAEGQLGRAAEAFRLGSDAASALGTEVYGRGAHAWGWVLLSEAFTSLHLSRPPLLRGAEAEVDAALRLAGRRLRAHLRATPLVEPALAWHEGRLAGDRATAEAAFAHGQRVAERLDMRFWAARLAEARRAG